MFNFSRPLDITIITKQIIEVTSSDSKFPPSPFRIYHDITLYRVVSNFFYTHDECTQQTFAIHKLPKPPFIIAFPLLADRSSPNWEGTNTIPRGTRNRCRRWGEGKKVGREGANRSTKPRFPGWPRSRVRWPSRWEAGETRVSWLAVGQLPVSPSST